MKFRIVTRQVRYVEAVVEAESEEEALDNVMTDDGIKWLPSEGGDSDDELVLVEESEGVRLVNVVGDHREIKFGVKLNGANLGSGNASTALEVDEVTVGGAGEWLEQHADEVEKLARAELAKRELTTKERSQAARHAHFKNRKTNR